MLCAKAAGADQIVALFECALNREFDEEIVEHQRNVETMDLPAQAFQYCSVSDQEFVQKPQLLYKTLRYIHTHIYTNTRKHTHTNTHTHVHTNTHKHTNTNTHTHQPYPSIPRILRVGKPVTVPVNRLQLHSASAPPPLECGKKDQTIVPAAVVRAKSCTTQKRGTMITRQDQSMQLWTAARKKEESHLLKSHNG